MKHAFLAGLFTAALAVPALATDYTILAPAAPGGGWDQTARTMQEVLQAEGISDSVQVQNVPGAGGTVGLAQFASQAAGKADQLARIPQQGRADSLNLAIATAVMLFEARRHLLELAPVT